MVCVCVPLSHFMCVRFSTFCTRERRAGFVSPTLFVSCFITWMHSKPEQRLCVWVFMHTMELVKDRFYTSTSFGNFPTNQYVIQNVIQYHVRDRRRPHIPEYGYGITYYWEPILSVLKCACSTKIRMHKLRIDLVKLCIWGESQENRDHLAAQKEKKYIKESTSIIHSHTMRTQCDAG